MSVRPDHQRHWQDATRTCEAVLDSFGHRKIVVLGDLMLDRFVYGDVSRISPEAPAPVILAGETEEHVGGAGNVARNIAALSARCVLIAVVGEDEAASAIGRLLGAVPNITPALVVRAGGVTTIKTRFVANLHGTHLLRADREDLTALAPEVEDRLLANLRKHLAEADALVLSDYRKGVLSVRVLREAIAAAREGGKLVVVDPKGLDHTRYAGAEVITPNVVELGQAVGRPLANADEPVVEAGRELIARIGVQALLVTRGERGVTVLDANKVTATFKPTAKAVLDVSGAGDTVVAGFVLALVSGAGTANAARLANAAAGVVVAKRGTAFVSVDELRELFFSRPRFEVRAKIFADAAAAKAAALDWRRQGLVVGLTNGCFDLLHPGHIALLAGARSLCDRLIVGLNADASVKRLKGESRPIQDEASRATVLAALAMVDGVVVFGEDTPLALISALQPDVLVKGADYTLDQVVGRDVVEAHGGGVALVEILPNMSTTRIVAAIAGADGRSAEAARADATS